MTNFEKFKEKLPKQGKFYSSLTGKKISYKEYDCVLNVWNKFEIESRNAMLKTTKTKLELITDPEMHIFFEIGTRDGFFHVPNRSSKTNNKYLKSYDLKQESKDII